MVEASDREARLKALHRLLRSDPDAVARSIEAWAESEAAVPDPLEEELEMVREDSEGHGMPGEGGAGP